MDLPSAIRQYQTVLQYARSKVDFVFGRGLYMAPSDMLLQIGHQAGYNNEIVIAGSDLPLGHNDGVNEVLVIPTTHGSFSVEPRSEPQKIAESEPAAATDHHEDESHPAVLLKKVRSQEATPPIMPGSAAAAFPASFASTLPKGGVVFFSVLNVPLEAVF